MQRLEIAKFEFPGLGKDNFLGNWKHNIVTIRTILKNRPKISICIVTIDNSYCIE